ncbi:hypothetical protein CGRA01v4_05502 [Colletotrichum graminicola]|nr:hypothetical protein CGRA01v4_05502 [Colletotrichum graminicola]
MLRTITAQRQILIIAQTVRFSNVPWDIRPAYNQLLDLSLHHGLLLGCSLSFPLSL